MLNKMLIAWFVVVLLALSGCLFEQQPENRAVVVQQTGTDSPVRIFDLNPVIIVSRATDNGVHQKVVPGKSSEPQMPEEEIPTNLLFVTCESGPTEVAVPLNAEDGKFCDTVQIYPYRSDDNGSYGVSGSLITWDLPEDGVAQFLGQGYGPGGSVRRLVSLTDAFWSSDKWDEPETLLTACVKPPAATPHAFAPICRSLPVRAIINIEGAWCFNGATFQGDCHDVEIRQDGRELYVDDDVLADGQLLVRNVTFNRDNDYIYDGILDSHEYMYGIVRMNGYTDVLGTWTAWKLPLY
ncbi:hypothetical protein HZC53_05825 [Candidatus Uhrbacteria bacterium]|nr:hypothetical protein [Candidatus Uhrbacteria bacterium]